MLEPRGPETDRIVHELNGATYIDEGSTRYPSPAGVPECSSRGDARSWSFRGTISVVLRLLQDRRAS